MIIQLLYRIKEIPLERVGFLLSEKSILLLKKRDVGCVPTAHTRGCYLVLQVPVQYCFSERFFDVDLKGFFDVGESVDLDGVADKSA